AGWLTVGLRAVLRLPLPGNDRRPPTADDRRAGIASYCQDLSASDFRTQPRLPSARDHITTVSLDPTGQMRLNSHESYNIYTQPGNQHNTLGGQMRAGWSAGSTLAMLLLALLAGGGSGCGALAPSSGSGSCRISAENPHQSSGSSAFIVGKARIRCNIAVDSAVLKVRIERLVNRKWAFFAENAGDGQPYSPVVPDRKDTPQATNLH